MFYYFLRESQPVRWIFSFTFGVQNAILNHRYERERAGVVAPREPRVGATRRDSAAQLARERTGIPGGSVRYRAMSGLLGRQAEWYRETNVSSLQGQRRDVFSM